MNAVWHRSTWDGIEQSNFFFLSNKDTFWWSSFLRNSYTFILFHCEYHYHNKRISYFFLSIYGSLLWMYRMNLSKFIYKEDGWYLSVSVSELILRYIRSWSSFSKLYKDTLGVIWRLNQFKPYFISSLNMYMYWILCLKWSWDPTETL